MENQATESTEITEKCNLTEARQEPAAVIQPEKVFVRTISCHWNNLLMSAKDLRQLTEHASNRDRRYIRSFSLCLCDLCGKKK